MTPPFSPLALHPSTQAVLALMQRLKESTAVFTRVLDIGAGQGALSFQAAALWPYAAITACDISEAALADMRARVAHQQLDARITLLRADGVEHQTIHAHAPYDLMLANLLAEVLLPRLPGMVALLADDGVLILAGILAWKEETVREAAALCGLEMAQRATQGEWVALLLQKAS